MNALLQLLVPASLLFAAPADTPERARGHKANKMQRLDADGSGTLSATEVAGTKLEMRFSKIDADGDGELTTSEMRAHHRAHHKGHRGKEGKEGKKGRGRDHRARSKERFAKRDVDGSGSLSAAEVAGTKMEKHFSKIDADGDGEVTMLEMRAAKKHREAKKGERGDEKARKGKQRKRGGKKARKSSKRDGKQARKATRHGGKRAFAKRGKGRTDRKRFAQRGRKNAA